MDTFSKSYPLLIALCKKEQWVRHNPEQYNFVTYVCEVYAQHTLQCSIKINADGNVYLYYWGEKKSGAVEPHTYKLEDICKEPSLNALAYAFIVEEYL